MKIEVLMSTYNGEKYLKEQIESIIKQIDVSVHITIRDDGSTDNTIDVIKNCQQLYPENISFICGGNIGYKKSFISLLSVNSEAEYFAFCDQDDVWKSEKLISAIKKLESDTKDLYYCCEEIVDENLNYIKKTNINRTPQNLIGYFIRGNIGGCTFVFTRRLHRLVLDLSKKLDQLEYYPDHDFFIGTVAFGMNSYIGDKNCYILHRRLKTSVTAGGNGLLKRLKIERKIILGNKNFKYIYANFLLDNHPYLSKENIEFLKTVIAYKKDFKSWSKFFFMKKFVGHSFFAVLECKIRILFHIF